MKIQCETGDDPTLNFRMPLASLILASSARLDLAPFPLHDSLAESEIIFR